MTKEDNTSNNVQDCETCIYVCAECDSLEYKQNCVQCEDYNHYQPAKVEPFTWEKIDDNHTRVKVFGGWIVKAFEDVSHQTEDRGIVEGWDWRISMCFVPDPNHEWNVQEKLDYQDNYEMKQEKEINKVNKKEFLKIRKTHFSSRDECASVIGVSQRMVYRYEEGSSNIPFPVQTLMWMVDRDPALIDELKTMANLD